MGIHYGKADFINYGKPSLLLDFARNKSLVDRISGNNLITFARASTGTYMDANGLIVTAPADAPRFDHRYVNGEIESLGLLVEEQRSNLITYSDTLTTGWSHIGFTSNAVDSSYPNPTGNLGTKKLVEETGNTSNQKVLYEDVTVGNNDQVFSHSIFVKPIGDRNAQISIHNAAPSNAKGFTVNFNLSGLTTFTTSASDSSSLVDYGVIAYPNGWYRIYVVGNTGSLNSDGTTLRFHLRILDSTGNSNYTGDGSSGLYAYGAQMELGAFPTSYIPRPDASTKTRNPDNASITGSNFTEWYNQTGYTIFTNHIAPPVTQSGPYPRVFNITTTASGDSNRLNHYHAPLVVGSYRVGVSVIENNATQVVLSTTLSQGLVAKMASRFAENNSALSLNGTIIGTDTNCSINSVTRDIITIGSNINGSYLNSTISQLIYYPNRLTNSQLVSLTR